MSTKDHVAVRLDQETLARIDAIQPVLDSEWREATRSDVLRLLILDGLGRYEKKQLGKPPSRGRLRAPEPATPAKPARKRRPRPAD